MSSSPIASTLSIIFIASLLLLFSTANAASSSTLIQNVCSITIKNHNVGNNGVCVKLLGSRPGIASATNYFNLTVEMIKSGISISTRTRKHIESLIANNSSHPGCLRDCKMAYNWMVGSLRGGLAELQEKDYISASYDLLVGSTDAVEYCQRVVSSKGMKDQIIIRGNQLVPVFGLSAFEALDLIPTQ